MRSKKFSALCRMFTLGTIKLTFLCLSFQSQAGLLDDLLKNPTIQGLISRPDLSTLVAACRDAGYRQANAAQCQNIENAGVLSKLPNEMRVLMGNPQSAQSLRELCTAVFYLPQTSSYLCAELRKAEATVGLVVAPPPIPASQTLSPSEMAR